MADVIDATESVLELEHAQAMAQNKAALEKARLAPKGTCYGCGEDLVQHDAAGNPQPGDYFAGLGYTLAQMQHQLFCPTSAEECEGYYRSEQRSLAIQGRRA